MTSFNIQDIQYTPELRQDVLVREINERLRLINLNFVAVDQVLSLLSFLVTTRSFVVTYVNQAIELTRSRLDVYVTNFAVRAPDGNMDVTFDVERPDIPSTTEIILDPVLSPIPVTNTNETYDTLSLLQGGNANMKRDDVLFVNTTNGSLNNDLYITVKFDIEGLSEDPALRSFQIAQAFVDL